VFSGPCSATVVVTRSNPLDVDCSCRASEYDSTVTERSATESYSSYSNRDAHDG